MGQIIQNSIRVDVDPFISVIPIKCKWINFQLKDKHCQTGFLKTQSVLRLRYKHKNTEGLNKSHKVVYHVYTYMYTYILIHTHI